MLFLMSCFVQSSHNDEMSILQKAKGSNDEFSIFTSIIQGLMLRLHTYLNTISFLALHDVSESRSLSYGQIREPA